MLGRGDGRARLRPSRRSGLTRFEARLTALGEASRFASSSLLPRGQSETLRLHHGFEARLRQGFALAKIPEDSHRQRIPLDIG
jgi:hypothetical protein